MTRSLGFARILLIAGVGLGLGALASLGDATGPAEARSVVPARVDQAASEHRAVVVVDTGSSVRTACVRFREASISGTEALRRAGMDPVTRSFGGQGAAVCSLCGKGCPADGSCLTCGGSNYWNYYRQLAGATGFTYARTGAGSVQVRDGDVEGWRWGNGSAPPPLVSVDAVCGPAAVAPAPSPAPVGGATQARDTPTAPAPANPGVGTPVIAPANGVPGDPVSGPGVENSAGAGTTPSSASVEVAGTAAQRRVAAANDATSSSRREGSPVVVVLVGATIALLVGALVWWAGRRRIGSPS